MPSVPTTIKANAASVTGAAASFDADSLFDYFTVKDQYGNKMAKDAASVTSVNGIKYNIKDLTDDTHMVIKNGGTKDVTFSAVKDDKFTVEAVYNGLTASVKVEITE